MRRKSGSQKEPADKVIKDIRRATRKQYSAEEELSIGCMDRSRTHGIRFEGSRHMATKVPAAGRQRVFEPETLDPTKYR